MKREWLVVLLVGTVTALFKAAGPLLLGAREPTPRISLALLRSSPALLGALIATQTFASGRHLTIDARLGGLLVVAIGARRRTPPLTLLVTAVAATAALRALLP